MTRFHNTSNDPVYSELKPERCPDHAPLDERQRKEQRRVFMEEVPLPEELDADRPRETFSNNGRTRCR